MVKVKICGVTSVDDAKLCVDAGADAIGINFVATSARRVTIDRAQKIARAVKGKLLIVGVVAGRSVEQMLKLKQEAELECLQLHGDEPPDALAPLLPHAYKALRIGGAEDVALADAFGGEYLLVDAKVDGVTGGSGKTFDWSLVVGLAKKRKLTLAGGLTPVNVAEAVRAVRPYCVDVASGVEAWPGVKDPAKLRSFVDAAKRA